MEQNKVQKDWLSIDEVIEEFGFSRTMQSEYRKEGKIPYSKLGRKILYSRKKLNEWLESLEMQG